MRYRDSKNPNSVQYAVYQHISSYVTNLRDVSGYYKGYVGDHDVDTPTADNAYHLIEEDLEVAHCLDVMSLGAAADTFEIGGKNRELNYIVRKALSYISDFLHSRKQLIYDARLKGLGLQRKRWKKLSWREYPGILWDVPYRLEEVDRDQLRIERNPKDRTDAYWTIWEPAYDGYIRIIDRAQNPNYEGPQVQDFVWFFWETEPTFPMYRGGGQVLYKLVYIKDKLLNLWSTLCEKYSHPFVVALIDTMRSALAATDIGAGFVSADERMVKLLEKIDAMVAGNSLVLDKNADDVRFHDMKLTGSNVIEDYVKYIDKKINNFVVGASLSTGEGEGKGSYAMQSGHRAVTTMKQH